MEQVTPPAESASPDQLPEVKRVGPYRLVEQLGEGGMGIVFRAEHIESTRPVALKTSPSHNSRAIAALRREGRILAALDHPGVVTLLDRGVESGIPWLALELFEGETFGELIAEASPGFDSALDLVRPHTSTAGLNDVAPSSCALPCSAHPVSETPRRFNPRRVRPLLTILALLCDALGHLHERGIVHRDLKPSNVFLRDDRQPVLVDFGLAVRTSAPRRRETLAPGARSRAGTVRYMAPEQLRGEPIDTRADLYALGCMLYLAITGRHPFEADSVHESVRRHLLGLYTPADRLVEGLPLSLSSLIEGLLVSDPDRRILQVDFVRKRLAEILGKDYTSRRGTRKADSDRAPLQPRRLLGRDQMLDELVSFLPHTDSDTSERSPALVLIDGPHGSGKTRLASEFIARARNSPARVSVASTDPAVGGNLAGHTRPLWVFRPTLQLIVDHCREFGPRETERILGRRAGVLSQFEPALGELPGVEASDEPVELPSHSSRVRAITYLTETLRIFADDRPLAIVVDNLHRADELSLELIDGLTDANRLDDVLIVATARCDGADRLTQWAARHSVQTLTLEPLDRDQIGVLVGDMLSVENPPDALVEMAHSLTDGSPHLACELVYAAVEEGLLEYHGEEGWRFDAGNAGRDEVERLLDCAGPMRALIERRIERLGDEARRLLEMAAVCGKRVEEGPLAIALGLSEERVAHLLDQLCDERLFDSLEDGARRVDAQVRCVVYERLDKTRRRRLHHRVARTIEHHAGDRAEPLHLVEQWRGAGVDSRELVYLNYAAERALRGGAFNLARQLLERALVLIERLPTHDSQRCRLRRARIERLLAEAAYSTGRIDETIERLERSLDLLGFPLPQAPLRCSALGLAQVARQCCTLIASSGASTPTGDQRERLIEVIEAGIVLLWPLIYRGQGRRAAILAVVIANLADRLDDRDYALPYAALGETCRQLGLARFARIYTARARQALDRDVCFIEFGATARIFIQAEAGHGRWSRARRLVERALDCSERVGDRRGYEGLLCTRALVELTRGPDARIETIARRLDTLSEQSGNPLAALWNNVIWMLLAYQRDDLGAALDHAASVSADRLIDALPVTRCHLLSVEAACLARRGEFDCAFGIAWRAFEHFEALTEGGDVNFFLLHSYRALAEACYHCGVADAESAYQPARALDLFDDVVDRLGNLAKRFPAARPALLRNRGRKAALKGDTAAASALYSQSLRQARRLDMPFDDKLTRRAAARLGGQ